MIIYKEQIPVTPIKVKKEITTSFLKVSKKNTDVPICVTLELICKRFSKEAATWSNPSVRRILSGSTRQRSGF